MDDRSAACILAERSAATVLVDRLVEAHGKHAAHEILDAALDQIPTHKLAALRYDWGRFWARPKQLLPNTNFRSFGFLTARGTGKTTALAQYLVCEIAAGRVRCLGMAAQNETKTVAVQVQALLDASPPWARPEWHAGALRLVWPNGAIAFAFTPEVPGAIRSPNLDASWLSEIQSWPASGAEAYVNFQFATRVGRARMFWDATPKKRSALLRGLLRRSEADPRHHVVVRGTIYENVRNLSNGVVRDLEAEFGGTQAGREELLGEMLAESEGAMVMQAWIDKARRRLPSTFRRRVVGIDPAVTSRAGSDMTGIIVVGLGVDDQVYVLENRTGRYGPPEWTGIVLDLYTRYAADVVVVETNKGGEQTVGNLQFAAQARGLQIVTIGKDESPRISPASVNVREVFARGAKEDRASPLATAYERGRISHVIGADLASLEDTLTSWEPKPGANSPDDLDALVHAVVEALGLRGEAVDHKTGFRGIVDASRQLQRSSQARPEIAALFRDVRGGRGRI